MKSGHKTFAALAAAVPSYAAVVTFVLATEDVPQTSGKTAIMALVPRPSDVPWSVEERAGWEKVVDKRLLVIESELAQALAAMHREGNSLSGIVRLAWDGSELRTLVKREPIKCAEPHVAILAAVTAEELHKRLDQSELWNGFGNRFLWLLVSRPHLLPEAGDLPWSDLASYLFDLSRCVTFAKQAGELKRSAMAVHRWAEIYADLAKNNHGGAAGVLTDRAEAHVLRISMLFALLDRVRIVEPAHLDAALAFWRFAEASVLAVFGGLSRNARNVAAILNGASPGELSRDDIRSKTARHLFGERLSIALAELLKAGLVACRRENTPGRTRELWRAV